MIASEAHDDNFAKVRDVREQEARNTLLGQWWRGGRGRTFSWQSMQRDSISSTGCSSPSSPSVVRGGSSARSLASLARAPIGLKNGSIAIAAGAKERTEIASLLSFDHMSRRGSRGIPIAPPPVARPSTSLDLVFSVARAASFYGSQLDSPSFVHRYTRPQGSDDDQALDTESLEDRSESHLTTSPDESSDEEADLSLVWDREQAALDQRPKNAVLTSLHERFSSELLEPNARVDENTSLLRAASSPDSFSRRTAFVQNARMRRSGTSTAASFISRRLSVISSDQVFEAAINRRRGESTKNQTLFNCVNVLIGVALLGEPLAFSHSGWLLGFGLLVFCALVTNCSSLRPPSTSLTRRQTRPRCCTR